MVRASGLHQKLAGALHYEVTTRAAPEYEGWQPNGTCGRPGKKENPARIRSGIPLFLAIRSTITLYQRWGEQ